MADRVATRGPALPAGAAHGAVQALGVLVAIADFPLLAAGYRAVIGAAADIRIVGAVDRRDRVVDEVARLTPDIVVIEAPASSRDDSPWAATIGAIRDAHPAARILAIESPCGRVRGSRATDARAHGFLSREARPHEVLAAIRRLASGETWTSVSIPAGEATADAGPGVPGAAGDDAFDTLGERAREVFRLAAVGHSSQEIARLLGVTEEAVHDHRALIMRRLGLHRRVELLRYALRHGIVRVDEL